MSHAICPGEFLALTGWHAASGLTRRSPLGCRKTTGPRDLRLVTFRLTFRLRLLADACHEHGIC